MSRRLNKWGAPRGPSPWDAGGAVAARPLWPGLAPPVRYLAGAGLLGFCVFMPSLVSVFRAFVRLFG